MTLKIFVVFNKTLRASEANGACMADQVSKPGQAQLAGAGGPVQADHAIQKQFLHYLEAV